MGTPVSADLFDIVFFHSTTSKLCGRVKRESAHRSTAGASGFAVLAGSMLVCGLFRLAGSAKLFIVANPTYFCRERSGMSRRRRRKFRPESLRQKDRGGGAGTPVPGWLWRAVL